LFPKLFLLISINYQNNIIFLFFSFIHNKNLYLHFIFIFYLISSLSSILQYLIYYSSFPYFLILANIFSSSITSNYIITNTFIHFCTSFSILFLLFLILYLHVFFIQNRFFPNSDTLALFKNTSDSSLLTNFSLLFSLLHLFFFQFIFYFTSSISSVNHNIHQRFPSKFLT